jgi:hypothetical protein
MSKILFHDIIFNDIISVILFHDIIFKDIIS